MTDLEALRRAILAYPDDDVPRLIYADALEEAGESSRAAFVRTQVELATLPPYDPLALRCEHFDRNALTGAEWRDELPDLPDGLDWPTEPFRRGFPAVIEAENGAAFVNGASRLFELAPVEHLRLKAIRAVEAVDLARCQWLSRLTRLTLPAGLGQSLARRLLGSPHLTRLTELHVGSELTSPQTAAAVVRSPAFRRLTALVYRDEHRGGAMVDQLTTLADPPPLRKLDLAGNRLTAERLARLVAAPALSAVEDLGLGENTLGPGGCRALAAGRVPALRLLHLAQTWPGEDGVHALCRAAFLPGLRSLHLGGNHLGPAVGAVLAGAPVRDLCVLDLRDNRLGDGGTKVLAGSSALANLMVLDLTNNQIEDDGAEALAASPHLGGLIYLGLSENLVTPAAVRVLRDRFGDRVEV